MTSDTRVVIAEQGIVGRGVLLDFHSWRLAQDPPIAYDPFKSDSIPLKYLKATAEAQGTEIKFGDILVIRSGMYFPPYFELLGYRLGLKKGDKSIGISINIDRIYGGSEREERGGTP